MPRIHFPYHNYLGPGTDNFNQQPIDEDDAIARLHDLEYNKANTDNNIFKADKQARDEFFNSFVHSGNLHSLIGGIGLGTKNLVEEHVLGKSLYGMGKRKSTEKDWAKIKRINRARAARRENENQRDIRNFGHVAGENINADAEVNIADFPDFLQDFVAEAGPSGSQPIESAQESPQTMSQDELPMDTGTPTEVGEGGQVDPRSGGQAAGGMGAGGAANDGKQDIYAGAPQPNQHQELIFGKSYHFTLTNGLADFRHVLSSPSGYYLAQQRFKHIHGIPWERLLMYISEGELLRLYRDYTALKVEEVICEIYSLGVRLPFVTSATTSSVANANAQYPIGCFHFDQAYQTAYNGNFVQDIINKALGAEWKNSARPAQPVTTEWSENFPNISASSTSRDISNPVIVEYPIPYGFSNVPKDVGIYDYVDIKNGTTAYGKCWEKRFRPKNGIIYAESTLMGRPGTTTPESSGTNYMTPIPGLENGYFMTNSTITERNDAQIRPIPKALSATKNNMTTTKALQAKVDYMGYNYFGEQKCAPQAMPKFMIGFVNIRNEDNSLLTAKWDILVKTRIRLTGMQATREWVARTETIPPQWFTSQYTQFRYEDIGASPMERTANMTTFPTHRPQFQLTYNPTRTGNNTEDNRTGNDQEFLQEQRKLRHKSALLPIIEGPVTRSKKLLKQ
uniref:VP n=1 Tax=Iteradensovirus sp. TaxID=2766835 RepID=A0A7G8LSG0_9VIRU|nr:VP [Iteradensovirus sp.]